MCIIYKNQKGIFYEESNTVFTDIQFISNCLRK